MNLQKDHYRDWPLPARTSSPLCTLLSVALAGLLEAPTAGVSRRAPARGPQNPALPVLFESHTIVKTFNNGSLGSGINEERSEMR